MPFLPDVLLHSHTHAALSAGGIALHLLADLDVDVEELADAAVEADGFTLVQVAFAVVIGDTFLGAGFGQAVEHVRDHLDFGLCGRDLLCRGHLGGATEEERHCDGNMVFLLIG